MKIISYAFDVERLCEESISRIVSIALEIDHISIDNHQTSEVIITSASRSNLDLLQEAISDKIFRNTTVRLITSDKRSKTYTRATLVADTFVGDHLVLTRTANQMQSILFNHSIIDESFNQHLTFLKRSSALNNRDFKLYSKLNEFYEETIIDESSFGFVASRQAINSVMSSEYDIYDLFVSLAISNFDRSTVAVSAPSGSSVYSDNEILEILNKFSKTSISDHLNKMNVSISYALTVLSFLSAFYLKEHWLLSTLSIPLTILIIEFISASTSHLSIISRQSFASSNKKYVAGNSIVDQINTKKI